MVARKHHVLGLDIGRHAAKAVVVAPNGTGVEVLRTEMLRIPAGGFDRKAILGRWVREHGLGGLPCVIGLSGQQTMFQPLFLVPDDPRTPEQVAAVEILKLRDIASEAMSHSVASFGGTAGERRLLMAMVRPSLVTDAMDLVRDVGLDLLDIVPSPIALFNALAPTHATGPTVFAHIGGSQTEVAIGGPDGLMFARTFAVGGQPFTEALAKVRQLQVPHAENLKVSGACALDDPDPAVSAALKRVADLWSSEFQSCLAVFNSLFTKPADRPDRIVLSGGGALLAGLGEHVARKTGLAVTTDLQVSVTGRCDPPAIWAVALGLAAGGVRKRACDISFLPKSVRDEQVFRREKPFWLAAGITAALILVVSVIGGYFDFKRMEKRLSADRESLARKQELVAQTETVQARSRLIRSMAAPVDGLLRNGPTLREILSLVASAKDSGDWITLICDGDSYQSKSPSAVLLSPADLANRGRRRRPAMASDSATNRTTRMDRLVIEGWTPNQKFSSVRKLIDRLESSDMIASADLLSDDQLVQSDLMGDAVTNQGFKRFVIDVRVKLP